jgi:hypothetical protein
MIKPVIIILTLLLSLCFSDSAFDNFPYRGVDNSYDLYRYPVDIAGVVNKVKDFSHYSANLDNYWISYVFQDPNAVPTGPTGYPYVDASYYTPTDSTFQVISLSYFFMDGFGRWYDSTMIYIPSGIQVNVGDSISIKNYLTWAENYGGNTEHEFWFGGEYEYHGTSELPVSIYSPVLSNRVTIVNNVLQINRPFNKATLSIISLKGQLIEKKMIEQGTSNLALKPGPALIELELDHEKIRLRKPF